MAAVASRYARAFADVVIDAKLDTAKTVEQVRAFVETFNASEELRRIWESPAVPAEQKRRLLDSIAVSMGDVQRTVRNFLAVLIDHSRIAQLPEIARQFETELNMRLGRIEADVISARELTTTERDALAAQVAKTIGRQVSARYAIDPSLLGGAVVKVGSTVYDGSVRGQLQRIKQELTNS